MKKIIKKKIKKVVKKKKAVVKKAVVKVVKKKKDSDVSLADNGIKILAKLNTAQELFCQLYVKNEELRGNGGMCYAIANGVDVETLSREEEKDDDGNILSSSEHSRVMNVCYVSANRLLRNIKISTRIRELLNEMLEDNIVDAELAKVILQDTKLESKIAGIREYNKLKQRIIEKVEVTLPSLIVDL